MGLELPVKKRKSSTKKVGPGHKLAIGGAGAGAGASVLAEGEVLDPSIGRYQCGSCLGLFKNFYTRHACDFWPQMVRDPSKKMTFLPGKFQSWEIGECRSHPKTICPEGTDCYEWILKCRRFL